jgi:hypothetical protein
MVDANCGPADYRQGQFKVKVFLSGQDNQKNLVKIMRDSTRQRLGAERGSSTTHIFIANHYDCTRFKKISGRRRRLQKTESIVYITIPKH